MAEPGFERQENRPDRYRGHQPQDRVLPVTAMHAGETAARRCAMDLGKPRKIITVQSDEAPVPEEVAEPLPATTEEEEPTSDARGR